MNYSANEMNLSGGSSAAHLNASAYGVSGSAAASPGLNISGLGNRSVLKELNTNESNSMVSKGIYFCKIKTYD